MRLLLFSLLLSGCAMGGALGQATLVHDCAPGEAGCHRAMPAAPIAVGARVRPDVRVDIPGSIAPVVALRSSREDVVAIEDGALVGKKPGLAAVLIGTSDGTVIDFQHVWVAQPTAIVVDRELPDHAGLEEVSAPLELVAGEQLMLTSSLLAQTQPLAGVGDLDWTVQGDAGAIALLHDGTPGRRRLVARKPGAAHVVISALGVSTTLDVEVVP
jgi:hypothetical protein